MAALTPYLSFAGSARSALEFYRDVFGGDIEVHTFADFGRGDGDPQWVAHGALHGPVSLFAADAARGAATLRGEGLLFALLGTGDADMSTGWFRALAASGEVVDDLQERPWGDWDGQVRDRFGVTWLIGYHPEH
ncbi:MAG: VOC family protein [Microbacterium arborescens]